MEIQQVVDDRLGFANAIYLLHGLLGSLGIRQDPVRLRIKPSDKIGGDLSGEPTRPVKGGRIRSLADEYFASHSAALRETRGEVRTGQK